MLNKKTQNMKLSFYLDGLSKFFIVFLFTFLISCDKENIINTPDNDVIPIDTKIEDAWVYFKDKPSKAVFLADPLKIVTLKSKLRREKQGIAFNETDVPIESTYYTAVKNTKGVTILAKSKWLNALHVQGTKTNINTLLTKSFVARIDYADKSLNTSRVTNAKIKHNPSNKLGAISTFNYGGALNQVKMNGGEAMHLAGYTGSGMTIAILDNGFPGVNSYTAFNRIMDNNKVLGGYNFVKRGTSFYSGGSHGTSVLSTIAGFLAYQYAGSAPDASFYLFITEDDSKEVILEESLWVEAAERADSVGVDIINTSLGYSTFDYAKHNHTYADMNGNSTFISRGAKIATTKGMILLVAAGNEGADTWKYITAPADVDGVLTVGAVDLNRNVATFSSFGPTFDARIKPDALAMGKDVYIIDGSGNVKTSSGTSFASPILAGVVACYWQKYPTKTSLEIIDMVKKAGHLYSAPTPQGGYGIPNLN